MRYLVLFFLLWGCVHFLERPPEKDFLEKPEKESSLKFEPGQCVMLLGPDMEESNTIIRIEDVLYQQDDYGEHFYQYRWWLGQNQKWGQDSSIFLKGKSIDKMGVQTSCPQCEAFTCCQSKSPACEACQKAQKLCDWNIKQSDDQ